MQGVGVFNNSLLTLDGVTVNGNIGRATGPGGAAQGAGIWNGVDLSGPPVQLTLTQSSILDNQLAASPGIERQGGGLYTTSPVTLAHTVIVLNRPDQCVGCSTTAKATTRPELGRLSARQPPILGHRSPRQNGRD